MGNCKIFVIGVKVICENRECFFTHFFLHDVSSGAILILRLTCPKCSKDSYSASVEKFKPCPYCGVLFSGKYGPEKRRKSRSKKELPSAFTYQGQNIQACTLDVSDNGICLKIFGNPSLPVGETVDLNIDDVNVKAQVRWSDYNRDNPSLVTGLEIL